MKPGTTGNVRNYEPSANAAHTGTFPCAASARVPPIGAGAVSFGRGAGKLMTNARRFNTEARQSRGNKCRVLNPNGHWCLFNLRLPPNGLLILGIGPFSRWPDFIGVH